MRGSGVILKFRRNDTGKDFVVGDLHGRLDQLMEKLSIVNFNFDTDRLFACGDLIDRGDQSLECLDLLHESWFYSVRGNHDQMLIDAVNGGGSEMFHWHVNGGGWSQHFDWFELNSLARVIETKMPHQIEIDGRIGIIHADVGSKWRELGKSEVYNGMWCRERIQGSSTYGDRVEGIDKMYVGHSWRLGDGRIGNVVYMDNRWDNGLIVEEIE